MSNKTKRSMPKARDSEMVRRYESHKAKFDAEVAEFKKSRVPTPALRAALALHSYISDRAKVEGVEYDLSISWFWTGFQENIRGFFGVVVSDTGFPITDNQEPSKGYFGKWMRKACREGAKRARERGVL